MLSEVIFAQHRRAELLKLNELRGGLGTPHAGMNTLKKAVKIEDFRQVTESARLQLK